MARALQAYLCDAGLSLERLSLLDLQRCRGAPQVGVLVLDDSVIADWLPAVVALHGFRPGLSLIIVAGRRARGTLWRSFQDSPAPPLMLPDDTSPARVGEAVRFACENPLVGGAGSGLDPREEERGLTTIAELSKRLVSGASLHDQLFDRFLPARLNAASDRFWTPLEVVRRGCGWLDELGIRSVADIGSGVGKFCIAGALVSSCSFIGVEQRSSLVSVARQLSRRFCVDERVVFIEGRFGEVTLPAADCYYFYNPFEENVSSAEEALDHEVPLSLEVFRRDLAAFRDLVARLPSGAHLLTYNGVGGRWPGCLEERRVDSTLPARLRLLQKVHG